MTADEFPLPSQPRPAVLHGYFRSSASWRVRIALRLKGLSVHHVAHHLRKGEQRSAAYLRLNPQGLVPTLELDDGTVLTQSLAIIHWLDDAYPDPPLRPKDVLERAKVEAFSLVLAADTHPVQNLAVLARLRAMGIAEPQVQKWAAEVNAAGLAACEALLRDTEGPFCFGDSPGVADICLVPQLGNARRFGVTVEQFPRLLAAEAACAGLAAFIEAVPSRQVDAE
ncbi:maleylacetoacetate isomerase [Sinorhizobium sp. BG8]|uniref:maleylacetoacetate isomerase n=1 Tax=Sinorhizobium sp. BG8 TaxID=2613773 RepID=UPI00193D6E7A|nr:maleylacetoacetate isomerase [Sinorhizobium sp. BG8]QRM57250.1 maleylacetoacetate isomerase [Sinorhizobium sp. BG8]